MYAGVFLLLSSMGIMKAEKGYTEELPLPHVQLAAPQQAKSTITGTIVDQTGEPIIGANVI
ncbi:MAG: carboxypeptidase-like regulatory domain-containing protein, partial [Tannerellaceae bacterium]|nr:carboxypeptidase-like regulatory domain-containing protein [Tannerellaceae bacterium]